MAITSSWTPFANSVSLLTLRNSINTFNGQVVADLTAHESTITTLGMSKISVADTGMVYVVDGTMPSASLTTTYQKVGMVNTTLINEANGHITVDNVNFTYTINTTGVYRLDFAGAMTADNGDLITFNYNVNGSSAISNPPEFTGAGATRVSIDSHTYMQLTAGAVIYIEAKSNSTSTMTPYNCGLSIEKTHY